MRQLSTAQLQVLDVLHGLLTGLICWYAASEVPIPPASGWHEPGWMSIVAAAVLSAPVVFRRRHPLISATVVVSAAAAVLISGVVPDYAGFGPLVAVGLVLYTVGTDVSQARSLRVVVLATVAVVAALALAADSPFGPRSAESAFGILVIGTCWALGWMVRERRIYAARHVEQATARAVDEERLRIAREVHDVVAHSLSLIAVKATIANHIADDGPGEMRDALRVIESTSREALLEMQRTLSALRTRSDPAPVPGMSDLSELVAAAKSAGLRVDLERCDEVRLPPELGTAVFRIVQEALTNVVKHAGATRCRVMVASTADGVRVEVSDDGRGAAPPGDDLVGANSGAASSSADSARWTSGSAGPGGGAAVVNGGAPGGHGLVGMRERVALYGGTMRAGPAPGGGWRVEATLDVRP